ncbi:MAG TPA: serine/threonine-protein kinase [Polyangia bacterium]|nr:serine/threonine-protein kinase [Polyangia bacterium]
MGGSESRDKDSVTEVAGESFVRERPPDIERGTVLAGRYQIEDIIGKGGSGIVLRVFDRVAQNVVALKVLKSELARDAKWEKRFSRELRLGRPIQHPNVCRIFDIGEADGYRFLTMELASGGSLRDELKKSRALERPLEERLADGKAVIAGLAALHAAGVVHRDFKPDNILRMGDGRLVLSDFGLATDAANAPGATVLIGTPHYMAPEVLGGDPASARSDVWALGVVLHEIFFGRRPERRSVSFDGSGKGPLRPTTTIERAVLALCDRCLLEAPLDRPTDATVVAKMLESARPSTRTRAKLRERRFGGYALAVLAAVGGGTLALRRQHHATPAAVTHRGAIVLPAPTKPPTDWTNSAKVISEIPEKVHCFSLLDERTARVVWGEPRRAEEVDLATGRRSPARLAPDTYQVDCPELSPDGASLLFTGLTAAGAKEIRLSTSPDGRNPTVVTSGSEALWIGNGDEFLYLVDPSHAAVFSVRTMSFILLPDSGIDGYRLIVDKAVSNDGRKIATLLYAEDSTFVLVVYGGRNFSERTALLTPGARKIEFGSRAEEILAADVAAGPNVILDAIDWPERRFTSQAKYSGFDLVMARFIPGQEVVLARRAARDAWMVDGTRRVRLTSDGGVFGAARSRTGDLLLVRMNASGKANIWWQGPKGASKRMTDGTADATPAFSADGETWAYADYTQKAIVVCATASGKCTPLRRDDAIPAWPTFSPDGESLAYLTQVGSTQLTIVSARDGHYRTSWGASYNCPPVWSSPTTLWNIEVSEGRRIWYERDLTGRKTGKRFQAPANSTSDEAHCWESTPSSASPFSQPVHVEIEQTSLLLGVTD